MKSLLSAIVLLVLFASCRDDKDALKDREVRQLIQAVIGTGKPDLEKTVLLSAKYGVEQRYVHEILDTYSRKHDPNYRMASDFGKGDSKPLSSHEADSSYAITIVELSNRYNLPTDRIASMLIDFKIWTACEGHQSSPN